MPFLPRHSLSSSPLTPTGIWPWVGLLAFALAVYVFGLGGQYVPTNGDEMVYAHIARLTAASGHWLPLVSDLDHMRNTKPPLLFWQAMVAGGWGDNWTMAALRLPSLIYTFLIAGAIGWTVHHITRDLRTACLSMCVYLAFFCTYRYGRTYLTSAPETFWLNLPMFWLLWRTKPSTHLQADRTLPGWLAHGVFGLWLGLGLAYKSFALIAPAAATLWTAQLMASRPLDLPTVVTTSAKVMLSAVIALGVFGLWFALDPDPRAVWQEFVIGENAGKMTNRAGYWHTAMWGGGFSIWAQLLGYAQNAGLLAFLVLGLMGFGLQQAWTKWRSSTPTARAAVPNHLAILLVWVGVWLLVFTLPSQRSARYLIPAMPAVAMLVALYWHRIARAWFVPSLLLCLFFFGLLGRIAWATHELGIASDSEWFTSACAVAIGVACVVLGLTRPTWTRMSALVSSLMVFAVFALATVPLNGPAGRYGTATVAALQQRHIAVPSSFNGKFERFEFLLPGNRVTPYDGEALASMPDAERRSKLQDLLMRHDAVVWLQTPVETTLPACSPSCAVLDQRWEVKSRHRSGEINLSNLMSPQTWLFRKEWLLSAPEKAGLSGVN